MLTGRGGRRMHPASPRPQPRMREQTSHAKSNGNPGLTEGPHCMKPFLLSSAFVAAVLGAAGGAGLSSYLSSLAVTAHAQGKRAAAPGLQSTAPSGVGTWFGIARPCPATGDEDRKSTRLNSSHL